jgi:hypothetical protein
VLDFLPQIGKGSLAGSRHQVDDDVIPGLGISAGPAPENFPDTPFHPMTHHRLTNLAAGGDTQAGVGLSIRMEVQSRQRATPLPPLAVAAEVVGSLSEPLFATQSLTWR